MHPVAWALRVVGPRRLRAIPRIGSAPAVGPGSAGDRPGVVVRGEQSGTHDGAPDGFLMAYGTNVTHGEFPRGAIVDLAPTVLYYMGVPVGRDMDGYPRTDLFQRSFTLGVPTTYIATHER